MVQLMYIYTTETQEQCVCVSVCVWGGGGGGVGSVGVQMMVINRQFIAKFALNSGPIVYTYSLN